MDVKLCISKDKDNKWGQITAYGCRNPALREKTVSAESFLCFMYIHQVNIVLAIYPVKFTGHV